MAFRELRNFTEILRALGYPRLVAVDNFRQPHFALVADILYWMTIRYEPNANISDDIDTERERVEFVTSVARLFATKAGIKLNCKRLYAADGRAVKELLKVANTLYSALRSNQASTSDDGDSSAAASTFTLSSKLADLKQTNALGAEITEMGAKIYDLLRSESELRESRSKALRMLDQLSGNMGNDEIHSSVQRKLRSLVNSANDNVQGLEKQARALESDQKSLAIKIKKKSADLERSEKRLKSLQTVRPAFMDEYEKLEMDLQQHYEVYLERFRNLAYLEHELDLYNRSEQEKVREGEDKLKNLQSKIRAQEREILRGKDDDVFDDDRSSNKNSSSRQTSAGSRVDDRPMAAAARREGRLADRGRSRLNDSSESEPSGLSDSGGSLSDSNSSRGSMSDHSGRDSDNGRDNSFSDRSNGKGGFSDSGSDDEF